MSETDTADADRLIVSAAPERGRYEARIGAEGPLAAILTYDLTDDRVTLRHTEVLQAFEGQGVGSRLVREVFDDLRTRGLGVVARCPFVVAWLRRHPHEQDILVEPLRAPDPSA
jgi:predicted GNAT family acetyltransferase